jgi:hypothetical protein
MVTFGHFLVTFWSFLGVLQHSEPLIFHFFMFLKKEKEALHNCFGTRKVKKSHFLSVFGQFLGKLRLFSASLNFWSQKEISNSSGPRNSWGQKSSFSVF